MNDVFGGLSPYITTANASQVMAILKDERKRVAERLAKIDQDIAKLESVVNAEKVHSDQEGQSTDIPKEDGLSQAVSEGARGKVGR